MDTVALQTPLTYEPPALTETRLLTSIAAEYNATVSGDVSRQDLRWWIIGNPPRAIAIVTKGKIAKQVKTISKTNTPDLWLAWQPVITEWLAGRANNKRQDHNKLTAKGKL